MVTDVKEDEVRAKELYTDHLLPFTFEYIMEVELIDDFYAEDTTMVFESAFTSDYHGLVYNRIFENLLASRLETTQDILVEMKPIYEINVRIISMINLQLKK